MPNIMYNYSNLIQEALKMMIIDDYGNGRLDYIDKSKLRSGMRLLTYREGWMVVMRDVNPLIFRDRDVFVFKDCVRPFSEWNDDLTFKNRDMPWFDVVAACSTRMLHGIVKGTPDPYMRDYEECFWKSDLIKEKDIDPTKAYMYDLKGTLRTGDLVKLRNGKRYIVMYRVYTGERNDELPIDFGPAAELKNSDCSDLLINIEDPNDTVDIYSYTEGLWYNYDSEFDVMEIVRFSSSNFLDVGKLKDKAYVDELFTHKWWHRTEKSEAIVRKWLEEEDERIRNDDLPF